MSRCPRRSDLFHAIALVALAFAMAALPTASRAQAVTGNLSGRVVDESGTPVYSAVVTLTGPGGGDSHMVRADETGTFYAIDLPPGKYTIQAIDSMFGCRKLETSAFIDPREITHLGDLVMPPPGDQCCTVPGRSAPSFPLRVRVTAPGGAPIAGVQVSLRLAFDPQPFQIGATNLDGVLPLFCHPPSRFRVQLCDPSGTWAPYESPEVSPHPDRLDTVSCVMQPNADRVPCPSSPTASLVGAPEIEEIEIVASALTVEYGHPIVFAEPTVDRRSDKSGRWILHPEQNPIIWTGEAWPPKDGLLHPYALEQPGHWRFFANAPYGPMPHICHAPPPTNANCPLGRQPV